jgi:flavin reductase (DIM6/NTAB) family NADH-FMN oxidoreductase RutF
MKETGFEAALGRIPSGIFVVTGKQGADEAALLASWVQQASFEPPTVSVAVHRDRPVAKLLPVGAAFVLNILSADDKDLYKHFVRGFGPGVDPFAGVRTRPSAAGGRILSDAMAHLECRVRGSIEAGDHRLIVAEVEGGGLAREAEPRVHVRKSGLSY